MAALPRRAPRLVVLAGLILVTFLVLQLFPVASKTPRFVSSSVDWSRVPQHHPPTSIKRLPKGRPHSLPPVQAPRSAFKNPHAPDPRRDVVRDIFKRSYDAYRKHAWLRDELRPVTGGHKDPFGGWAATLVDALDSLWIMGFEDEFREATAAAAAIDFGRTDAGAANLFETTIRHLGGLLSAYDLSGDEALLRKAVELGEMLYLGFDTPNRMPGFWLNFDNVVMGNQFAGTKDPSACPASLCLEFTRLSQLTGDPKFYAATDHVTRFLERTQQDTLLPGMWPTQLDFRNEEVKDSSFTLGALADSLYEYLPKMHALLGGVDETYANLYRGAMDTASKYLLFRPMVPGNKNILFAGDYKVRWRNGRDHGSGLVPESQHLTCFAGGMFGLGGKLLDIEEHVDIGERLTRGCGWAYGQFPTGVMPEIFTMIPCDSMDHCEWDEKKWQARGNARLPKGWNNARDPRYMLRPEAIESVFILYRMTGKEDLRDLAWDMFQGIVTSTETKLAHSAIRDVNVKGETEKTNSMEVSFR
jgi:mannosyl-oligosaccharide alpha-1,2-mannosidase